MPGVPDIYWGGEFWDFTLVDPDNRRPVDWTKRRQSIDRFSPSEALSFTDLAADSDGAIKQAVIVRLLALRRRHPELFRTGAYQPLEIDGDRFLAYARSEGSDGLIVIVPVRADHDRAHTLLLPPEWRAQVFEDVFSMRMVELAEKMPLSSLLTDQPFAVLQRRGND
jgi:(1->4)-alpha-D-glucan 1-alpha-D-glucosylmutase